jgi:hypothetical protein
MRYLRIFLFYLCLNYEYRLRLKTHTKNVKLDLFAEFDSIKNYQMENVKYKIIKVFNFIIMNFILTACCC